MVNKKMLRILLVMLVLVYSLDIQAQKSRIDSIANLMNSQAADTLSHESKMRNYLTLSSANNHSDFALALDYGFLALKSSKLASSQKGEAMALNMIGIAHFNQGSFDSSYSYYDKALTLFESIYDTLGIVHTLNNLGILWKNSGNYEQSILHYREVLELTKSRNQKDMMAYTLNNIAIVYYDWKYYELALEHYQESLGLLRELGDSLRIAPLLNNIGELLKETGNIASALAHFNEALRISQNRNIPKTLMNSLLNIGDVQYLNRDLPSAADYFSRAIETAIRYNYPSGIAYASVQLGKTYLDMGRTSDAFKTTMEGLNLAVEQQNIKLAKDAHYNLYNYYLVQGNEAKALEAYLMYSQLKDSLFDQDSRNEVDRLRTEYETEKKENEIALLGREKAIQKLEIDRQKNLRTYTSLLAALILFIGYLIYTRFRLKQRNIHIALERDKIDIEQRLLRSQMNPHFIFNCLNSINSFIVTNNTRTAQLFLTKFSQLIRLILENSRKSTISLQAEINTLQLNLELEQMRFNNQFDFTIQVADGLVVEDVYVPPMLVQPFVENALFHGIIHLKTKGEIMIQFLKVEAGLHVSVTDNGVGREKAKEIENRQIQKHESLGLQLTKERLDLMGRDDQQDYSFTITDLITPDGVASGTQVDIVMPCELDE